ncbi:molybdenum cofactor cytidylyltransferase [Aeromonas hydrophila]|uniref:molybdenum cofactor cytidylyltransferase n=2 Tax=Aeromonas hydrophila TaxID=644 RepID=UPI00111642B5|nr:molybdenum cofactor cytidylyltransferase [Aeromonas hydrophila]TNH90537.1 molybdenum cofactor cytidylyltransferase [Aeromonas hydrophila]
MGNEIAMATTDENRGAVSEKHWHSRERCDCLITAAGLSSRMGAWKLMLPYRQSTILDESLKNALVLCDRVILVVGHRADELISRYANHPRILLVHNHDYAQGLGSSIRAGLAACSSDHLFVSHGDLPCIPPEVYRTLWQARGDETLFPSYQGEAGHPVLLPRALAMALAAAPAQGSVRRWLLAHPHRFIEVQSAAILQDVDTPERYQALLANEAFER